MCCRRCCPTTCPPRGRTTYTASAARGAPAAPGRPHPPPPPHAPPPSAALRALIRGCHTAGQIAEQRSRRRPQGPSNRHGSSARLTHAKLFCQSVMQWPSLRFRRKIHSGASIDQSQSHNAAPLLCRDGDHILHGGRPSQNQAHRQPYSGGWRRRAGVYPDHGQV